MPIFAYRCERCGFGKDVLQKRSDPPLTVCPSCGEAAFSKQLTAPAFQLKGSGWYVTDFRDKGGAKTAESAAPASAPASAAEPAKTETAPPAKPASGAAG